MSIAAAVGRIDQILTLQQQLVDPAPVTASTSATSPSGGASLTAAGTGSTSATNFASALAAAQGMAGSTAAAIGSTDGLTGSTPGLTSGLAGSTAGLAGSTAGLAGSTAGVAGSTAGLVGSSAGITGGLVGSTGGVSSTGAPSQVQAMIDQANSLVGKPYVWGGGHSGWGPQAGYDCSGFVSAVLHAGGYLSAPQDTQTLPSQPGMETGPGQYVTIYDRTDAGGSDHVIIDIAGQFYESGGETGSWGGGGGVAKIATPPASYLATFNTVLHPQGL